MTGGPTGSEAIHSDNPEGGPTCGVADSTSTRVGSPLDRVPSSGFVLGFLRGSWIGPM
jgi:hypothetical protein